MNTREYVELAGITAEVIEDHGVRTDDGWQHRAATVRLANPQTGRTMITPWRQGMGVDEQPGEQVAYIVDSLISDVWGYLRAGAFEEWANEYGYDTDSRKAEAVYRTIGELAGDMVKLVGGVGHLEHLATEVERL